MLQLRDKHCRHAVKSRAALFFNSGEGFERIEVFGGNDHRGALCHAAHGSQHAAETVIERNRDTEPIVFCQLHAFGNATGITDDVEMRKPSSLWKTCRSRSVLNVDDIVWMARCLARFQFIVANSFAEFPQIV